MTTLTVPIPDAALDDRLAFVGTSGSGKTYGAGTAVEKLLSLKHRVVIVDPLGVWWGLRLLADGHADSRWPVVIFGGPHGDLPINEHAGALIGETVAGMRESCIVALDGLKSKSDRRRFMLGFLEALYERAPGEPFHFIVDEADLFAPQKTTEPMLQSLMEDIVRRGRVKGFIPWLITQRPAVLSKDVLSQADGLVAMKLTASQDRDALGAWIEGNADVAQWKDIRAALPTLEKGHGVIWLPGHGVLEQGTFPAKVTFDSSRTPKRGEKRISRDLKPLDVEQLRGKLAKVEAETAANDPAKLRAQVKQLEAQIRKAPTATVEKVVVRADPAAVAKAERKAYRQGYLTGHAAGAARGIDETKRAVLAFTGGFATKDIKVAKPSEEEIFAAEPQWTEAQVAARETSTGPDREKDRDLAASRAAETMVKLPRASEPAPVGGFSAPQTKILRALSAWRALGNGAPTKAMIGFVAGYSPTSSTFTNILGALRSAGAIDYPASGCAALRIDGFDMAIEEAKATFASNLSGPQRKMIDALSHGELGKAELADGTGYSLTSSTFTNILGGMRALSLLNYPSPGRVALNGWVFDLL